MMFRTDWVWLVGIGLCWIRRLEVKRRERKPPEHCSQEPPARRHKLPDWLESLLIAMSWAAAPLSQGILLTARIKTWDVSFFLEALQGCLHLLHDVPIRVEVTTATTSVPGHMGGWVKGTQELQILPELALEYERHLNLWGIECVLSVF